MPSRTTENRRRKTNYVAVLLLGAVTVGSYTTASTESSEPGRNHIDRSVEVCQLVRPEERSWSLEGVEATAEDGGHRTRLVETWRCSRAGGPPLVTVTWDKGSGSLIRVLNLDPKVAGRGDAANLDRMAADWLDRLAPYTLDASRAWRQRARAESDGLHTTTWASDREELRIMLDQSSGELRGASVKLR